MSAVTVPFAASVNVRVPLLNTSILFVVSVFVLIPEMSAVTVPFAESANARVPLLNTLYTILFDDPPTKVERLPARGADGIDPDNENAEFLNDAAV